MPKPAGNHRPLWQRKLFWIPLGLLLVLSATFKPLLHLSGLNDKLGCYNLSSPAYSHPKFDKEQISFIALGDAGRGSETQKKVAQAIAQVCKAQPCDFVLYLGDNFYENGLSSAQDELAQTHFQEIYREIPLPFFAILGNHDVRGSALAQIQIGKRMGLEEGFEGAPQDESGPRWYMPNYHYQLEAGPAKIVMINSSCPIGAMGWAKEALETSRSPWKILGSHHTLYSTGKHGDAPSLARFYWQKVYAEEVDLYLGGHDHHLEALTVEGKKTHYLISGGGAESMTPKNGRTESAATSLFRSEAPGFMHLRLDQSHARIDFYDMEARLIHRRELTKE